jgi:uncharacterized protein YbjT (DUF2867 family)
MSLKSYDMKFVSYAIRIIGYSASARTEDRDLIMLLVTGATGTVGRPLVDLLVRDGAGVRAVTRDPRAATLPGAEVVEGDPSRPETIAAALRGVTALFLNPAAVGAAAPDLLALARDEGVKRVVLLSALGVEYETEAIGARHRAFEKALDGWDAERVILRPGMFAANTLSQWAPQIAAGDVVRGPYALSTDAPIHERDLAEVAARALAGDLASDLAGRTIRLTGPRSLTRVEMAGAIGDAIGRPLRYAEIPADAARKGLVAGGVPEALADSMLSMWAASVGHPAIVAPGVEEVLGRPPRTFAEWAADHAADFTR